MYGFAAPIFDPSSSRSYPGPRRYHYTLIHVFLGVLVTNILGRKLISIGEALLNRIPLANSVYGTAKQITQSFSGASSRAFQKTVLIPYPRIGIWTMALLLVNQQMKTVKPYYHLFVPTTPNPTSGFMLIIPQEDAIDANLSVEEGLKAIISGGMLAPEENVIASKSD